jgi:thiamine-phosphate pyrophosphorylase
MNGPVLRILDANANRAREALRVIEDAARFALDGAQLCRGLKELRHDLQAATAAHLADAILNRDTPGDVGTKAKTPSELVRDDLPHIVTAAGKRLGEALRVIEECLKALDPPAAAKVESIRYSFYDIERRLALAMRPASHKLTSMRLYVLITAAACKGNWLEVAEAAIDGGADCLQLREKQLESGDLLRRARGFVALCRRRGVLSIINDRPDIALLAGADGVHVGQTDLPAAEARKVLGASKIVGVSTHNLAQAKQAVLDGADYIGVGPIFPSATKPRDFVAGLDYARQVAEQIPIPAVAISGITGENVGQVLACAIKAVAVTAGVVGQDDVRAAAAKLKATQSAAS